RKVERTLKFFNVGHDTEAALRIRMIEGTDGRLRGPPGLRLTTRCQLQQGLGSLTRKVLHKGQERVFGRFADVAQPIWRHTALEEVVVCQLAEQRLREGLSRLHVRRDQYFLNCLTYLHHLRGAR